MSQVLKSLKELGDAPLFPVTVPLVKTDRRMSPRRVSVPYNEARPDFEKLLALHKGNLAASLASIGYSSAAHDSWIEGHYVPMTAHLAMQWVLRESTKSDDGPTISELLTSDDMKWLAGALVKAERYDLVSKITALMARAK